MIFLDDFVFVLLLQLSNLFQSEIWLKEMSEGLNNEEGESEEESEDESEDEGAPKTKRKGRKTGQQRRKEKLRKLKVNISLICFFVL